MARGRDTFAHLERMRREIDDLFDDVWARAGFPRGQRAGFRPRVDVYYCGETGESKAVVKAELPGVDLGGVSLEVRGRTLIISGERRPRHRGARVPAGRDRARAASPRDRARHRRRRQAGARHLRGRDPSVELPTGAATAELDPGVDLDAGRIELVHDRDRPREDLEVQGTSRARSDALPVLPLKETVAFPNTMTPLAVGQERSVQLVNDVLERRPHAGDGRQQEPRAGDARPRDLYGWVSRASSPEC